MLCDGMASNTTFSLDVYRDLSNTAALFEDYLEFILYTRDFHEGLLDLTRIKIDALYDKHIISATCDAIDS